MSVAKRVLGWALIAPALALILGPGIVTSVRESGWLVTLAAYALIVLVLVLGFVGLNLAFPYKRGPRR